MSSVTYKGLRTGFPFHIPTRAEDGLPFELWDGETLGFIATTDDTYGTLTRVPSKTADATGPNGWAVTVYGPGSIFCVPLTKAQLAEYFWRVEDAVFSVTNSSDEFALSVGIVQPPTAGYYTLEGGEYVWNADPLSIGVMVTEMLETESENSQDRSVLADVERAGHEFDLVLDANNGHYAYKVHGAFESDFIDNPIFSLSEASASIRLDSNFGWSSLSYENSIYPHGYGGAFAGNVIQVGMDEFWLAPLVSAIDRSVGYIMAGLVQIQETLHAKSMYEIQDGAAPATVANTCEFEKRRSVKSTHEDNLVIPSATELFNNIVQIPYTLSLASGDINGFMFGHEVGWEEQITGNVSPSTAGITTSNTSSFLPAGLNKANKWWSYDGKWNTTTGAML